MGTPTHVSALSARPLLVAALALALVLPAAAPVHANWLTKLLHEAGESAGGAAGRIAKHGIASLDNAAAYVAKLPASVKGTALAAHATPEGHWKFVNKEGEVFTAANEAELARVRDVLAPEAGKDASLALYLSEDTVFRQQALLRDLPPNADLHLVVGRDAYRLARRNMASGGEKLVAEVRPSMFVEVGDRALFEEAVFQLARPLNRSNIRVLALEPGGPKTLSSVPSVDPATRAALVDPIDPGSLAGSLGKLKGQTVLLTGRVEGELLYFRPASGPEQKLFVRELMRAAEAADVNVVILHSAVPRQPGGRNWLWQKIEVAGLDDAMQRATFADFLGAIGAPGGELTVTAARGSSGRVTLTALPTGGSEVPLSGTLGEWIGEVTGNVVVKAVEVNARDAERERELDLRFIPGIPSTIQLAYLAGIVFGVLALGVARGWWARIWPSEQRQEYRGRLGFRLAQAARLAAFVLVFLPLAGGPALLWSVLLQVWGWITAPVRFVGWLRSRVSERAG